MGGLTVRRYKAGVHPCAVVPRFCDYGANTSMLTDPRERRIGEENRHNVDQALSNLAIFPFTRRLGMSIQEVRALVASACVDAANPALKAYFPL